MSQHNHPGIDVQQGCQECELAMLRTQVDLLQQSSDHWRKRTEELERAAGETAWVSAEKALEARLVIAELG